MAASAEIFWRVMVLPVSFDDGGSVSVSVSVRGSASVEGRVSVEVVVRLVGCLSIVLC